MNRWSWIDVVNACVTCVKGGLLIVKQDKNLNVQHCSWTTHKYTIAGL